MLHEQIRRLRTARGITQVELAHRLGVSKQSVSNWESNNIQPSIELLEKIADLFGVTTDYLLGREDLQVLDVSGLTAQQVAQIQQLKAVGKTPDEVAALTGIPKQLILQQAGNATAAQAANEPEPEF